MSLHLSAVTGEKVTPQQLLGTEKQEKEDRMAEAQKIAEKQIRKMKKAGLI